MLKHEGHYLSSGDVGTAIENAPTVVLTLVCSPVLAAGGFGGGVAGGLGGGGIAGVTGEVYCGFAGILKIRNKLKAFS